MISDIFSFEHPVYKSKDIIVQDWFRFICINSKKQPRLEHSDTSDKEEKQETKKTFKQQSFLRKSQSRGRDSVQPRIVKSLPMNNTNDSDDDSDDDVVIGGSHLNLRSDGKKSSILRDEGLYGLIMHRWEQYTSCNKLVTTSRYQNALVWLVTAS